MSIHGETIEAEMAKWMQKEAIGIRPKEIARIDNRCTATEKRASPIALADSSSESDGMFRLQVFQPS